MNCHEITRHDSKSDILHEGVNFKLNHEKVSKKKYLHAWLMTDKI